MSGPRPFVGPALVVVGAVHTTLTGVLYPDAVRGVLRAGVLDAVTAGPAEVEGRLLAFWFATAGLAMAGSGVVVTALERRPQPLPRALPGVVAAVGLWGVVLLPRSPFWVLLALGVVAEVRRRRFGPSPVSGARPPA